LKILFMTSGYQFDAHSCSLERITILRKEV